MNWLILEILFFFVIFPRLHLSAPLQSILSHVLRIEALESPVTGAVYTSSGEETQASFRVVPTTELLTTVSCLRYVASIRTEYTASTFGLLLSAIYLPEKPSIPYTVTNFCSWATDRALSVPSAYGDSPSSGLDVQLDHETNFVGFNIKLFDLPTLFPVPIKLTINITAKNSCPPHSKRFLHADERPHNTSTEVAPSSLDSQSVPSLLPVATEGSPQQSSDSGAVSTAPQRGFLYSSTEEVQTRVHFHGGCSVFEEGANLAFLWKLLVTPILTDSTQPLFLVPSKVNDGSAILETETVIPQNLRIHHVNFTASPEAAVTEHPKQSLTKKLAAHGSVLVPVLFDILLPPALNGEKEAVRTATSGPSDSPRTTQQRQSSLYLFFLDSHRFKITPFISLSPLVVGTASKAVFNPFSFQPARFDNTSRLTVSLPSRTSSPTTSKYDRVWILLLTPSRAPEWSTIVDISVDHYPSLSSSPSSDVDTSDDIKAFPFVAKVVRWLRRAIYSFGIFVGALSTAVITLFGVVYAICPGAAVKFLRRYPYLATNHVLWTWLSFVARVSGMSWPRSTHSNCEMQRTPSWTYSYPYRSASSKPQVRMHDEREDFRGGLLRENGCDVVDTENQTASKSSSKEKYMHNNPSAMWDRAYRHPSFAKDFSDTNFV